VSDQNAKSQPYRTAHTLLDTIVILICAASQKHQSQLHAGLCQQDGDGPAGLAEPMAAAHVLAEVGSLSASLNRMLRVSQTAALAEPEATASVPAEVGSLSVCPSRMLSVSLVGMQVLSMC